VHVRAFGADEPGGSVESFLEVIGAAAITGAPLHIVHLNSMSLGETPRTLQIVEEARRPRHRRHHGGVPVQRGADRDPVRAARPVRGRARQRAGAAAVAGSPGVAEPRELPPLPRQQGGVVVLHLNTPEMEALAMLSPLTAIASDGGLRDGVGHPRTAGTYARVLGHYVRETSAR
jgi:hypothetical protein